MAESVDAVVIGGGLAGVASALTLERAGRSVLVIEASNRLGGKAGSRRTGWGDFPIGPTSFNGRHPAFWQLLRLLDLEREAVRLHPKASARYIVRDGAFEAISPSPLSMLTTRALTLGDKLALAKDFVGMTQKPQTALDESLDAFLERRFGRSLVDHFLAAVFSGIFAGDLKQLSAACCMPALVAAEKEYGSVLRGALSSMQKVDAGSRPGLFTLQSGFEVIGERAARMLTSWLNAPVERVERHARGARVTCADGREVLAQHVVLATEAFAAGPVVKSLSPRAAELLSGFQYAPLALVQWAEQRAGDSGLPNGFGWLAAPVEQLFSLGTLFIGDLLDESPRRFTTFIGGMLQQARAQLPDSALIEGVESDLSRLSGGKVGQVAGIIRWPTAVVQPAPGHAEKLRELGEHLEGTPVVLAGSYLGGAAMKDAITSGLQAAQTVLARTAMVPPRVAASAEARV